MKKKKNTQWRIMQELCFNTENVHLYTPNFPPCDFVYVNLKESLLGKSIIPKELTSCDPAQLQQNF